jgi:hypothetical protein
MSKVRTQRFRNEFARIATDPWYWSSQAESLRIAADVLWGRYLQWREEMKRHFAIKSRARAPAGGQLWMQAVMLLGLGTENLLKAILVSDDPTVASGHGISWGNSGHDQAVFYDRGNLLRRPRWSGKTGDRKLLAELSEFVEWGGRYPVRRAASPNPGPEWSKQKWAKAVDLFERLNRVARAVFRR